MVGLPVSVGSGQIRIYHSSVRGFVLETNFGVTVRADWPHIVRITAPSTYNGTLGGLCGNLNGEIADEFYTPDGVLLNDTQLFAGSWRDGSLSAHCEEPLTAGCQDSFRAGASSVNSVVSWLCLMDHLLSAAEHLILNSELLIVFSCWSKHKVPKRLYVRLCEVTHCFANRMGL